MFFEFMKGFIGLLLINFIATKRVNYLMVEFS